MLGYNRQAIDGEHRGKGVSERVQIDMAALEGVEPTVEKAMWVRVLRDTPRAELYPVITRLWTAWDKEPERILAFFMRDNFALRGEVEKLLALDLLPDWLKAIKKEAVAEDSFAKMVVLSMAGHPVEENSVRAFKRAVDKKKYGMVLWALLVADEDIANNMSSDWHKYYLKLAAGGDGKPYLAAQLLNGAMARHSSELWQAGVVKLAKARGCPEKVGYFQEQGMLFATRPKEALDALVMPLWARYPGSTPQEDGPQETQSVQGEPDPTEIDLSAFAGFKLDPVFEMLGANLRVNNDQPRLKLLPLIMVLHTAWRDEPCRAVAFFGRDNHHLVKMARHLFMLDELTEWPEAMWETAVEADSLAKLIILNYAGVEPPRQPAAGFLEAVQAGKHQVAAFYMSAYGHIVAPGINHCWTKLYGELQGDGPGMITAQLMNGMMKKHALKSWQAGYEYAARKLDESTPLKDRMAYVSSQADAFAATAAHAMAAYVEADWARYPGQAPASETNPFGEEAIEVVPGLIATLFATIAEGGQDPSVRQALENATELVRTAATGLDREQLAKAVSRLDQVPLSKRDVLKFLDAMSIGER